MSRWGKQTLCGGAQLVAPVPARRQFMPLMLCLSLCAGCGGFAAGNTPDPVANGAATLTLSTEQHSLESNSGYVPHSVKQRSAAAALFAKCKITLVWYGVSNSITGVDERYGQVPIRLGEIFYGYTNGGTLSLTNWQKLVDVRRAPQSASARIGSDVHSTRAIWLYDKGTWTNTAGGVTFSGGAAATGGNTSVVLNLESGAEQYITAHEMGHELGLFHVLTLGNFMNPFTGDGGGAITGAAGQFDAFAPGTQCTQMRQNGISFKMFEETAP